MSEVVNRPSLRQCPHPEPKRSRCDKAWRVWFGRFVLGTVYQLHPRGVWYALDPTGSSVRQGGTPQTFASSDAAVQRLRGLFELHKPKRNDPESEAKSPYLKYPRNKKGDPELPPES